MLGSGINPESFKLDFSGFADAAATQAQGVANLGASIGGAISEVGDYFKKQKEDEKKVQKSLSVAKAIGDLIPGLQPTIKGSLDILNDKEIPLSQRTAEADAIADILNLGINEVRNRQDFGLRERALNIQEAEALARNAPKPVVYDFEPVEIPAEYGGKSGVLRADKDLGSGIIRTADGKLYRNEEDAKLQRNPIVQGNIDAGLNTGIPASASEAERKSILINNALEIPDTNNTAEANPILLNDFPDGMPVATETPAPVGAPTMTGTPVIDALPPGFTPAEAKESEGTEMTLAEVEELTAKGVKVNAVPLGGGKFRVTESTFGNKPLVEVNTGQTNQQERSKKMDTMLFETKKQLEGASQNKDSITKMINLLDEGLKTGFARDAIMKFNRAFGRDVSDAETFRAVAGNVAMGFINLTKGAISDREMTYFTTVLAPNLGNTPEGNRKIGKFMLGAIKKAEKIEKVISEGLSESKDAFDIDKEVRAIRDADDLLIDTSGDESTTNKTQTLEEQLDSIIKGNQ
jgi:hypothetical protein